MSGALGLIVGEGLSAANQFTALFSVPRYIQTSPGNGVPYFPATAEAQQFTGPSSIAVPDCAIEEEAEDDLTVTSHPVQRGANVSDHAYKEPATVTLRWAWSNSAPANTGGYGLGTLTGFTGAADYVTQIYEQLLALQVSGQLLTISTGKRLYTSMLITSLSSRTDMESEYGLPCQIVCQQLIIADTQTASIPASDQANPQQTQSTQSQGTLQAAPAPTPTPPSLLSQAFSYGKSLVHL
jgi:hypothetical protein